MWTLNDGLCWYEYELLGFNNFSLLCYKRKDAALVAHDLFFKPESKRKPASSFLSMVMIAVTVCEKWQGHTPNSKRHQLYIWTVSRISQRLCAMVSVRSGECVWVSARAGVCLSAWLCMCGQLSLVSAWRASRSLRLWLQQLEPDFQALSPSYMSAGAVPLEALRALRRRAPDSLFASWACRCRSSSAILVMDCCGGPTSGTPSYNWWFN